jgi:hypothetical protein
MHVVGRQHDGRGFGTVPKMTSSLGAFEDMFPAEPALPSQFHDIWRHSRAITPERELALAVLTQAVLDLHKFRLARRRRPQRFYMEAYLWVASDERAWPFSFLNLCDGLGLDADGLRERLLAPSLPDAAPAMEAAVEDLARAA